LADELRDEEEEDEEDDDEEGGSMRVPPPETRTCWHVTCAAKDCSTSVCVMHGSGVGHNEGNGYHADDLSYDPLMCRFKGCKK
jgi:hypothetical protein